MEIQHVNVKLLVEDPESVDLEPLIPIFHGWIQEQVCEELLLDVADYRHVHEGPGVVLIGHQANYSVDNADNRLGVRYNRKAALEGSNQDRLRQATRAALAACQRFESEPSLNGQLRFNGRELQLFINDRFLTPNSDRTREIVEPEFRAFLRELFGEAQHSLSFNQSDPRQLLLASAESSRVFTVSDLLRRVSG